MSHYHPTVLGLLWAIVFIGAALRFGWAIGDVLLGWFTDGLYWAADRFGALGRTVWFGMVTKPLRTHLAKHHRRV
jgi:hypothetical protein